MINEARNRSYNAIDTAIIVASTPLGLAESLESIGMRIENHYQDYTPRQRTVLIGSTLGSTIYTGFGLLLMLHNGIEKFDQEQVLFILLSTLALGGIIGADIGEHYIDNYDISYTALESYSPLSGDTNIEMV